MRQKRASEIRTPAHRKNAPKRLIKQQEKISFRVENSFFKPIYNVWNAVRRWLAWLSGNPWIQRTGNLFPACVLFSVLALAVPWAAPPAAVPAETQPVYAAADTVIRTRTIPVFHTPDRIEQLSTAGARLERVRAMRENGGPAGADSYAAALRRDRIWQLSSGGMRMESLQARRNGTWLQAEHSVQFALYNDTIYAFTEETEERWVVIDNSVSGGNIPFSASENAEKAYSFAKEVLGLNTAAACGMLANLQHESGFNPHAVFVEADGRISYGICQWNAGRLLALHEYCEEHGYDPASLSGQLQYLRYELNGRERAAFYRIRSVPDTGNGAYEAGYNWARYFERCADRYYPGRAETAYSTYWVKYGSANERFILSVIGETFPPALMRQGTDAELRGIIRSEVNIKHVSAVIRNSAGTIMQSYEQDWNNSRYDLISDGLNDAFRLEKLPVGEYVYEVSAADLSGTEKMLIQSTFTVSETGGPTIPEELLAVTPPEGNETAPENPESVPENGETQTAEIPENPDVDAFETITAPENMPESIPTDAAPVNGTVPAAEMPDTASPDLTDEEWAAMLTEGYDEPVYAEQDVPESALTPIPTETPETTVMYEEPASPTLPGESPTPTEPVYTEPPYVEPEKPRLPGETDTSAPSAWVSPTPVPAGSSAEPVPAEDSIEPAPTEISPEPLPTEETTFEEISEPESEPEIIPEQSAESAEPIFEEIAEPSLSESPEQSVQPPEQSAEPVEQSAESVPESEQLPPEESAVLSQPEQPVTDTPEELQPEISVIENDFTETVDDESV